LWPFINRILAIAGLPLVTKRVPFKLAYAAGAFLERAYAIARRKSEPPMTRFVAAQLAYSHWFDISAARNELGFVPDVSIENGLKSLAPAVA
jgi:nucleoside-diphosphate-sugar epimerase